MSLKRALVLAASSLAFVAAANAETSGNPAAPAFAPASVTAPAAPVIAAPVFDATAQEVAPAVVAVPVKPGENPFAALAQAAPPAEPTAIAPAASAFAVEEPAPAPAAAPAASEPSESGKVDETALRYYAASRDLVRVGSEIRRLKSLYPDWQPPANLFATSPTIDETPFWDLYAKGDLNGIRQRIAEQVKRTPDWKPSEDLAAKVDDAQARAAISGSAGRGDWPGVITAAGKRPSLLVCANMDMLWAVGEAYARSGNFARSFDLYSYVLKTCDDPAERMATFQKARALLPPAGSQSLAALGRPTPAGGTEFASLKFDDLRGLMGKVAAGDTTRLPDPAGLAELAADVGKTRSAGDAMLFGWYFYAQKQWSSAADWFKAASAISADPKAIEGQALALRSLNDLRAAEDLSYANREKSKEIAKIYIEIISNRLTENDATGTVDEAILSRFTDVVVAQKSALGAQSIGWHEVADDDLSSAKDWFQKSVFWEPTKEGVLGLAVVAARTKDKSGLKAIKETYAATFPEIASFKETAPARTVAMPRRGNAGAGNAGSSASGQLMTQANAAFKSGDYRKAIDLLQQRKARFGHNGGAEILEGWANLKLNRWEDARRIFKAEDGRASTKDTRFGIGAVSNSQYNAW